MIRPVTSRTTIESGLVTMSASVRPASTDGARGRQRAEAVDQALVMSSASPSAVTKPPKAMFWTMIPGIRKSM